MCNLNLMCKTTDGSCTCHFPGHLIKPVPIPLINPQEGSMIISLFKLLSQQKELIQKISEDSKQTNEKISKIRQKLGLKSSEIECNSEESTSPEQLLNLLSPNMSGFKFNLQLISELPNPAHKEKPFSIFLQIVDNELNRASLEEKTMFNVMLFTTENPPKILKTSMSGDKVIRGTVEVEGNSSVLFKKIVIKEVSSHFRSGWFYLVVVSKNPSVRPLIVPNFKVKARKMKSGNMLEKKSRVECIKDS